MPRVAAVILFSAVILYAVFGGADFGAGFWDLMAGGAERGRAPREQIDASLGPVWEANHVWLIFCLVVLWTAFPPAFSAIMRTLYIPLGLAALGIVLRGSGFAFRKVVLRTLEQRATGAAFALSSVITPFFVGAVAGGIASGRVPATGLGGDAVGSWVNPTSLLGGTLAVVTCAFLAAVFLANDAGLRGASALVAYFRRRAVAAAVVAGALAIGGILVLRADSSRLYHRLVGPALPLVVFSGVAGITALVLLARGRLAGIGVRVVAVAAVASIVAGWGVAQYPYLLGTHVTISEAAAPDASLYSVAIVFLVAAVVCVPSLALLYRLQQRGELEGA